MGGCALFWMSRFVKTIDGSLYQDFLDTTDESSKRTLTPTSFSKLHTGRDALVSARASLYFRALRFRLAKILLLSCARFCNR